jgi:hypothetical protein
MSLATAQLRRALQLLLLLGLLLLAVEFLTLRHWSTATINRWAASEAMEPAMAAGLLPLPDLSVSRREAPAVDLSEFLERPPFSPQRRRPAPEPVAAPDPAESAPVRESRPPDPLQATLRSVLITPDTTEVWLVGPGDPAVLRLAPGDVHLGWRLISVRPGLAVFEQRGIEQVLRVRRDLSGQLSPVRPADGAQDTQRSEGKQE